MLVYSAECESSSQTEAWQQQNPDRKPQKLSLPKHSVISLKKGRKEHFAQGPEQLIWANHPTQHEMSKLDLKMSALVRQHQPF